MSSRYYERNDEKDLLMAEMAKLQEHVIILKMFLIFSPYWIMSIIAVYVPLIYAFMPVHGADICLCGFFMDKLNPNSWREYPALTADSYGWFQVIQLVLYYAMNYAIALFFIFMVYKIRHIRDDTKIALEVTWVGAWMIILALPFWFILSLMYYNRCINTTLSNLKVEKFLATIYGLIILRDLVVMGITVYF